MSEQAPRQLEVRPQVGLMLSIGEPPTEQRNYPRKLDYFRPKPGSEGQFAPAVEKFREVYGETPRLLDIVLLSNSLGDALDIRWKAWGQSGLRAIGQTNYALCPERMLDADDVLVTFPDDKPGSDSYEMQGPEDPVIAKTGLKLYGVCRFALHRVTGLSTLAEISTTSKRSMLNLLSGIQQVSFITGGQIAGIPFQLGVRPARIRYFDEKAGRKKTSTFHELIFLTPYSIDEFLEKVQDRRQQIGAPQFALPPVDHANRERDAELLGLQAGSPESAAIEASLSGLPAPADEDVRTREDPSAHPRPDDALLNRIAALETRVEERIRLLLLQGAFGVERADQLSPEQAERYAEALELDAEGEQLALVGEVVDE